jgi:hypothetical protein
MGMKRLAAWLAAAALSAGALQGCATATGRTEGAAARAAAKPAAGGARCPLAYLWRPQGNALWPLVTFSEEHVEVFPLYAQIRQDGPGGAWDEFAVLWPWALVDAKGKSGHVFPVFWGKDRKGKDFQAVFPLYWNGDGCNALLPLWWATERWWVSPAGFGTKGFWAVPWLGAWGTRSRPGESEWAALLGLFSGGRNARTQWVQGFPLFLSRKRRHDTMSEEWPEKEFSLLLGLLWRSAWMAENDRGGREYRHVSALAELGHWEWERGTNVVSRFIPFWNHRKPADFDTRAGWLDGDRLPGDGTAMADGRLSRADGIPHFDWTRKEERQTLLHFQKNTLRGAFEDAEGEPLCWDFDRGAPCWRLSLERKGGIPLLTGNASRREAVFDVATGEKREERLEASSHVLWWLYRSSDRAGVPGRSDQSRRQVLWRLFRWERDSKTGTAVDLLFVPVWRSGP